MPPIPGKACGSCKMCCQVLEIPELDKPAGPDCPNCAGRNGCAIYDARPNVCREFECEWLGERSLGPRLRPDLCGVIFFVDPDTDEYRAVSHPAKPMAFRAPEVFKHLVAMAKAGHVVVAKAGMVSHRIHANGQWGPWV
ncbi:MAG: hypothetical protein KGI57_01685 [Hyphomicrobiales bacterium]|nr:hypothetical protein [Hyphomicrobiales bacterium]MDE2016397.1 hypothetical protein [Hyphomicrobiales bacterium]